MLAEHSRLSGISQEQQFTILQCVTTSSRPSRLIELGSIIALLRKDTGAGLKEGKDLVRQACGRLLEILEDESVSVIHHSFTEFARDKSRVGEPGGFPVLEEKEAQRMMLDVCLQYLDSCVMPESARYSVDDETSEEKKKADDDIEMEEVEEEEEYYDDLDNRSGRARADEKKHQEVQDLRNMYPLIGYATDNLAYHIEEAEAGDGNAFDLLGSYFVPGSRAFEVWLLVKWHQYRCGKVQSLHVAAYLGLSAYAQHLITTTSAVDVRDAEGRPALSYAAEKGHVDIAFLLLSNGADPDSDDRLGYKPLHLAASNYRVEVAKLLLAAGVSPKTKKTKCTPELVLE